MSCVAALADRLCRELSEFDPALYTPDECTRLAETFARVVNACGAAQARAVLRASVSSRPEKFLSELNGSSVVASRDALRAASNAESGSDCDKALATGEISVAQAAEIVKLPVEEQRDLVALARQGALQPVRDEVRRRVLEKTPPDELHDRQHAAMRFKHWINPLGNLAFDGELPPEIGVPWANRLDRQIDRVWRKDRTRSRAQVAGEVLVDTTGSTHDNKIDGVVVVDINAYRRGHAHDGEPCHIVGGGPIPVDVARELIRDSFLKVVLHDGVNIHTIKHFGRHRKAELQTALDLGPPPHFAGASCQECGRKYNLQWDHVDPVANRGPTTFENLQGLCVPDHVEKTERDRKAGKLRRKRGPPPSRAA